MAGSSVSVEIGAVGAQRLFLNALQILEGFLLFFSKGDAK